MGRLLFATTTTATTSRARARAQRRIDLPHKRQGASWCPCGSGSGGSRRTSALGGSIGGSPSGVIKVFTDARAPGVYIAESNRTLASYSLAGAVTAPACMMSSVPSNVRNRLKEDPVPPQISLPSPVVPVTRSISDLTPVAPYEVTSTVSVPRSLPPC